MPAESSEDLEARRKALAEKISVRETAEAAEQKKAERSSMAGYAVAFRLSTELVGAVLVGGGIGYLLDWWLGISPWGLIVFFLLGFVAGVLNVLRSAGLIQPPNPGNRPGQ
jgi:ATP synthase protein I